EVLSALLDSFHRMPPGSAQWTRTRVSMLVEVARQSFEVGLRASAPVVISVLLAVLILGLVSRTLPQLNILAVGFGLNGLVLLATFAVSIGAAVWIFEGGASGLIDAFRRVMEDPSATWDAVSPTGGP
ncbi:MAG: flagellar biosynthetic protein FliR, partial [Planctomycetes bacterium]|nr:flagellar biosynthetic protein FliR [Planctomycetota bacterium]